MTLADFWTLLAGAPAAAIPFPQIDPNLISFPAIPTPFGPVELAIRWYALAYIAGLALGWLLIKRMMARPRLWAGGDAPMSPVQTDDLLFYMTIGVVLGGRLGYVLFYETEWLWTDPLQALRIWEGGMAFHGGMLGVALAVYFYARSIQAPLWSVADAVAVATPIGLFFGRIANFINAELWGRVTDQPWGFVFPTVEPIARSFLQSADPRYQAFGAELLASVGQGRHPSQLYEAVLEGLLLFGLLAWLAFRADALKRPGLCAGVFLAGYGAARALVEIWRQPDIVKNTEVLGLEVTRGQLLSLPMILAGLALIYWVRSRERMAAA